MNQDALLVVEQRLQAIVAILAEQDPDPAALNAAVNELTVLTADPPEFDPVSSEAQLAIHVRLSALHQAAVTAATNHRDRLIQALGALDRAATATRRYTSVRSQGGQFIDLQS